MSTNKFILSLLSDGMASLDTTVDLDELNKKLGLIGYDIVLFPGKDIAVLKNRIPSKEVQEPWKEKTVEIAKSIFTRLSQCSYLEEDSSVVDQLIECKYLKRVGGRLYFTERALVQFGDFIEAQNGRFKKCKLCDILTEECEYHRSCLEQIKKNQI